MIGTARRLADATGTMTDAYSLDAFGRSLGGWGSTENPYRYAAAWGYLTDYSGVQQLGARFYWPEVGRFIQQDPAWNGMNWYEYAGGSPLVYADPDGEIAFVIPAILLVPGVAEGLVVVGIAGGAWLAMHGIGPASLVHGITGPAVHPAKKTPAANTTPGTTPAADTPSGHPDPEPDAAHPDWWSKWRAWGLPPLPPNATKKLGKSPDYCVGDWEWHPDPSTTHGAPHWDRTHRHTGRSGRRVFW